MKELFCCSGDGCKMEVPDEVKAILDLVCPGAKLYIENRRPAVLSEGCYIDVEVLGTDGEGGLHMEAAYTWEEARQHFIDWVMNGCQSGVRLQYDRARTRED